METLQEAGILPPGATKDWNIEIYLKKKVLITFSCIQPPTRILKVLNEMSYIINA